MIRCQKRLKIRRDGEYGLHLWEGGGVNQPVFFLFSGLLVRSCSFGRRGFFSVDGSVGYFIGIRLLQPANTMCL